MLQSEGKQIDHWIERCRIGCFSSPVAGRKILGCAMRGSRPSAEPHEIQAGRVQANSSRGGGLTGVEDQTNLGRDCAGVRVRKTASTKIRSEQIPQIIIGLIYLLILTRFILPLELPLSIKIVMAAFALVALQFHTWNKLSSGSVFSPEFPRPVVVLLNWAFGAMILLALMQLVLDVGLLFGLLIHGSAVSASDSIRYTLAVVAAVAAAIGVRQAIRIPPLKDIEVGIRGLPYQFDGYTILQLTDLHISRLFPASWARAVVARSNALNVDLIAITGDLIDGTVDARRADIQPLRELKAIDGVYVISGNHEYIFGYDTWMAEFAALGLRSLENTHIVLDRDGSKLLLAGLTDRASRNRGHPVRDLAAVLDGVPNGAPVILLDHQPSDARDAARLGVALQMSGHTHGGLILGIDRLAARANAGYVSGRYNVDGMTLYVNNGTALWPGFALRLGCPSELTRITLRKASVT